MAKVTVWLTSYNHGKLLVESIDSVLAQTYTDYELVIIDDASTDGSQDVIRSYEKKDPRIRTILRSENVGHSAPYPYLETLKGEYIAILHGDDFWLPEKLEKQMEVLEKRPEVSACFTAVQLVDENGVPDRIHKNPFLAEPLPKAKLLRRFFEQGNCLCQSASVMRLSAYRQYRIDLEGYNGLADYEKWLVLALHSEICLIPEVLTVFRSYLSEENMSGERPEVIQRAMLEEVFISREFFSIEDAQLLLEMFPEARRYVTEAGCHIPFAVAQMMLASSRAHIRLAGLEKLMALRRDPAEREIIEKRYGYDNKAFDRDKQRYDLFGSWPKERFLDCRLYLNYGEGYREEDSLRQRVFVPLSGVVRLRFDLPEDGRLRQSIRFDPDEGVLRKIRLDSMQWEDGSNVSFRSENAYAQKDGADVFYTPDPQYILEAGGGHTAVCIRMKAETVSLEEICGELQRQTEAGNAGKKKTSSPAFLAAFHRHKKKQ